MSSSNNNKKSVQTQNLWETILSEAIISNNLQNGHLILLGNKNCGKRTFVSHIISTFSSTYKLRKQYWILLNLESSENNKSLAIKGLASAIDYSYILVKNPDDPDSGLKLNKSQII